MHNSEPWKLAFLKRVCSCAVPRAEHYEQQMLRTGARRSIWISKCSAQVHGGAFGFLNALLCPLQQETAGAWSGNSPRHWCVTVHQLLNRDALHSAKLWFIVLVYVLDGMSSWCNSCPKPSPTTPHFFLVPKTNKKIQNLSKYEHKDKY